MANFISTFLLLFALSLSFAASQFICDKPTNNCDASRDLFSEEQKINIKHASKTITNVTYFNNFVDVDIRSDTEGFKYRFVVCGCNSDGDSARQVIFINPLSFYIEDGPVLALYDFLAKENIAYIKAVQKLDFIFNQDIRDHVSNGGAVQVQNENFEIDYSKIKEENPVLSMIGTSFVKDYREADLDIPFLVVAEAQEQDPLARAEWIKIIGLVLDRSEKANEEFEEIEKRYNEAKKKAEKAVRRPAVFFNRPTGENDPDLSVDERYTWTQPVSDEYIVRFVQDANADYRYNDEEPTAGETGSDFNISTIVRDFKSADYLLRSSYFPGRNNRTLEDYLTDMIDPFNPDRAAAKQVEMLKAVRCATVWNSQKRVTRNGQADDFFESAIFRPDVLLLDFIQALHPYLDFGDRETFYIYRYEETKNVPRKCPFTVLSGKAPKGKAFVDTKFHVPDFDRYQVADRLEDKVIPAIEKRVDEPFEVFFHHEDVSEEVTVVTVRVEVKSNETDFFKTKPSVIFGMRESLGDSVRQRNDDGSLQDPPPDAAEGAGEPDDGGDGLSGGAIAGIVIGVIAAVLLIGVVLHSRRSRSRRTLQASVPTDHYWDDADMGGGGRETSPPLV